MENPVKTMIVPASLDLVERAVSRFPPDSHCQAISRWMSGAIQWLIPNRHEKARRSWQMCIEDIEKIIRRSDLEDKLERRLWYMAKVKTMKAALADMLKEVYSADGKAFIPNWETE